MNKDLSQGQKANRNGRILEETIRPLFKRNGYDIFEYKTYDKNKEAFERHPKFVLTNAPFTSIYGHNGRTEYLLFNRIQERKVRIEAKWQQSSGSVDEKFPYMWLNSVYAFEENEIILLIGGNGYKKGAYRWLKEQESRKWLIEDRNKDIKVFNIEEFIGYFNKSLA